MRHPARTTALCLLASLSLLCADAHAQNPSTQDIIDALSAPPMRTRSLRNLKVGQVSAPAEAPAPAPGSGTAPAAATPPEPDAPVEAPNISLSINFDFNSASLRADSTKALGNLAAALASPQLQKSRFMIEGHTDAKGGIDYNLKLSAQRAATVKAWLVRQGIDAARLASAGLGSSQLADPDPHAAANRRVRIITLQ